MKLLNYLIYLLSFLLMLLASCRSPKTMTTTQTTSDSLRLTVRDTTTNHFSLTFDSLLFSTTDFTDYTDEAAIPSGRPSVKSVLSVFNKNLPCSSVSSVLSVVNKNLPCSHLTIYGGKLLSEHSASISHDSIRSSSSSDSTTTKIRSAPIITHRLSLIILSFVILLLLILLFPFLHKKGLSH